MQIERTGTVNFHDASLNIWEEFPRGTYEQQKSWEREFRRQVFARIIQQLNRLGWTCELPAFSQREKDSYPSIYEESRRENRECRKGDLQGHLSLSGRTIEFEMWQDVANVENRNGGRYDFNKEQRMPYLLRLEMERTRRKIRDYLCNVFDGYRFEPKKLGLMSKCEPSGLTAMEFVQACYDESHHFKGNWSKWVETHSSNGLVSNFNSNRKTADGVLLEHGQRVYLIDQKGRVRTGTAYYNINNMWWVVSGKYSVTNEASFELHVTNPGDLRRKRNEHTRRKRLEGELSKAVAAMDFHRAETLRRILWPTPEPLFMVWHEGHKAYHCANFCGYTSDSIKAGKFTAKELKGWDKAPNKVIPLAA